jgi:tRNA dimethylallyltransferase
MKKKLLVVIAGPTAVGKTNLSIELAKNWESEILSSDSRQFFRKMTIGTAVPSPKELETVPHHFIQHIDITEDYSPGDFEEEGLALLNSLFQTKDILFLVGGSGLYIDALCKGLDYMPDIPSEIRETLNKEYEEHGLPYLQDELIKIDPEYASIVDMNNPRRLLRALEVYRASGKTLLYFQNQNSRKERPFDILKIAIVRDREELYERINQRVDIMLDQGLLEEVKSLTEYQNQQSLQTVGYQELFSYLKGEIDMPEAIRLIKRNSRRYAKRQLTWIRRDGNFHYFTPNEQKDILKLIENRLETLA